MINCNKVKVKCLICGISHDNVIHYGRNKEYPNDFQIDCKHCDNREEGDSSLHSFELIEA